MAGSIERVPVVDNQSVKAGDLLVKIDDRDYRAQLAHAEASVAVQQATLANLDAKRRLQEAVIEQASADIAATTAELARTKSDVDRYRTLSDNRFASLQRFQQADADYEKAQAADRKARAALDAAKRRLSVIDAEKEQTQATLDQAAADRDLARLNLGYTEIRAPIDGVVGNRSARAGAYATVGGQLLAIVPASALWVDANFKESQLARVRVGQPAEVIADVLPGVTLRGRVASLARRTRRSALSRRRMQPATSPRSCSVYPFASGLKTMLLNSADCDQVSRLWSMWTGGRRSLPFKLGDERRDLNRCCHPQPQGLDVGAQPALQLSTGRTHSHSGSCVWDVSSPFSNMRIVSPQIQEIGGFIGHGGRTKLVPDFLSDCRDHRNPALRMVEPGHVTRWLGSRLGRRVHGGKRTLRQRVGHPFDGRCFRALQGFFGGFDNSDSLHRRRHFRGQAKGRRGLFRHCRRRWRRR